MTPSLRRWVFLAGAGGLVASYLWGLLGLPGFGNYPGPFGFVINRIAVSQTKATGVVSAVNFDYRGFDTLGEEFILLTAAAGVSIVLRRLRDERERSAVDDAADRDVPATSSAVRMTALLFTGPVVVGGLVAGLARADQPVRRLPGRGDPRDRVRPGLAVRRVPRLQAVQSGRPDGRGGGGGAGGFVAVGVSAVAMGLPYLYNFLPLGTTPGAVSSSGTIALISFFVGLEVAAYALTAYRPEERGSLQGALNFAITNSVGAYLSLSGIALIYGRTGALNMAQIAAYIDRHPPDGLVTVAFLLVIAGLLIKSAIVPFHFWLADAHAVAPTPVCVLFSGVMAELGLYGIARVCWSVFGQALGHREAISHVFVALGVLTAVVGALFCFRERHIKPLLPFSTISHAGMFLGGIALFHTARPGRRGRLRGRPRPGRGDPVPVHRDRRAPAGLGQRDLAARPGPPSARHRRGLYPGRPRAGRPPAVRHLPGQGLH
jgi:Proton-conducting membrane transporter